MKGSAELAQQPGAGQVEAASDPGLESRARQSPIDAAVPFWVTACVRLMPPQRDGRDGGTAADKVLTAAQVLLADRLRGSGHAQVELKRDDLAMVTGYSSGKKIRWIVDYLVQIGFLVVLRHGGAGAGRKPDTFDIYDRPPAHYIGPRTYADLVRALRDPKQTFAKRLFVNPQVNNGDPDGNLASGARNPDGDLATKPQVSNGDPDGNLALIPSDQIDPSSSKKEEGSIEPVPGGTAEPPATGMDEAWVEEVREAARSFPIENWYAARGQLQVLSKGDTSRLLAAILAAMGRTSLTLEQVRQIGQAAVSEAKKSPVKYAEQAFSAANLPTWLARITPEPAARNPLPLLDLASEISEPKSVKRDVVVEKPVVPNASIRAAKCETCRAPADARWHERLVPATGEPCPECFPADQLGRVRTSGTSAQVSS